ncbi:hypothetical protein FRC00_008299, partial [Tulasnella sp. 408]
MFVFRVAISHIRAYGAGSHILYILIRDSLVWFVLLALCLLWNAVAWTAAPVSPLPKTLPKILRALHLINRISSREQPGLSLTGIPALHASATIGGCRMLLNLRAAYFESLQPRDIDSTAVSVFATDASIGRFRSLWTSSRKEDKPRQPTTSTADQALDHDRAYDDDRKAAERRDSIGMESWTSLNDHEHDRAQEGI